MLQITPELQILNQTKENTYQPFERLGTIDILKCTDQGMIDMVNWLTGCELLGAGYEGLVFMVPEADRVIKVLHAWKGASEFFHRLAKSHNDARCGLWLTEENPFGQRLVEDRDTMQSSISKINRRNWLNGQLPENILPIDSVFVTSNDQIFAYTSMALKNAEWMNWKVLSEEERAAFNGVRHLLDVMGEDNFARYKVQNPDGTVSSRIIANDLAS